MCTARIWKSQTCKCHWIVLATPCGDGKNLSNCPTFENGTARPYSGMRAFLAPPKACPRCDNKDSYDGTHIRMIKNVKYGTKIGNGPSKFDSGVECSCCNVMWNLGLVYHGGLISNWSACFLNRTLDSKLWGQWTLQMTTWCFHNLDRRLPLRQSPCLKIFVSFCLIEYIGDRFGINPLGRGSCCHNEPRWFLLSTIMELHDFLWWKVIWKAWWCSWAHFEHM